MIPGPDLSRFDKHSYSPGRPFWIQATWFLLGLPVLRSPILPSSALRRWLLRLFGAHVGNGVVLKPGIRVKYPWLLSVGDHAWIGEDAWIDNLAPVMIGHDVCISQAAYFCTWNHNWSDPAFHLLPGAITVNDGAWLGARSTICPGVTIGVNAVACAGSVVFKDIPAGEIHAGNPASFTRKRSFREFVASDCAECPAYRR